MEFVTSEGFRANSKIVHCNNGYFYKIKCTRTNSQSLQCIQTDYSATGLIVGNLLYEKRPHPHGPDMDYLSLVQVKQNILKRCAVEYTPHKDIFEKETSRARGLEDRLEFSSFLRTMERTRAAAQPKIPGDLIEYAGDLVDPRYSHIFRTGNGRAMFRGFVMGGPDAGSAVVFISPSLENLFTSAQELHIDATFKSRPLTPPTEQLLIIMAMYMDQAFPVAYALMTRRTEMAYRSVLNHIRTCIPGIVATNIATDYEVGLSNDLSNIFPGARLQKCWFHMAQALENNAKDFGMRREVYKNDDALHTMFRMSKALALLPTNKVIEGFEEVVRQSTLSPNVEVAERYILYFRNQWMERVGPENFSVHGMPRRTNNDQEIFHRHLNGIMNNPRPGIWHFTKTLLKVEEDYGKRYVRLQQRPVLRARRRVYIHLDRKINSACERLTQGRISTREFLLYTEHLAYDAERRSGNRINIIVPAQIVETIEGQVQNPELRAEVIPTANVGEDVVGGIGRRQVEVHNLMEQQQINADQFLIQDVADFVIPEDNDPVFHAIHEIEQRRMTRELEDLPNIPVGNNIALPRQINCCDICLCNEKTHACLPCGHKYLCSDCVDQISNRCPICNSLITNIIRIYD